MNCSRQRQPRQPWVSILRAWWDVPGRTGKSSAGGIPSHVISATPGPAYFTWRTNTGVTSRPPCWPAPTSVAKTLIAARYSEALSVCRSAVLLRTGLNNSWAIRLFNRKLRRCFPSLLHDRALNAFFCFMFLRVSSLHPSTVRFQCFLTGGL